MPRGNCINEIPTVQEILLQYGYLKISGPDPDSHSCGWITSPLSDVIHPQLWESGSDPDSHSCGWITSPLSDGIHPQLWESGSGYETNNSQQNVLKTTVSEIVPKN